MKILFAIDPWIYRDSVGNQMFTLKNIFLESIDGLLKEENDVKVLLGEDMLYSLNEENIKLQCEVFCIPLNELYNIYPNHYIAHKTQFNQTETLEQKIKTKKLILKHTKEWTPDVVISFTTPASIWKYVYENSMNLQFENGMFSRSPYPFMCQLDPFGFLKKSYPYVFMKELRENNINEEERKRIIDFRDLYLKEIFLQKNPIKKEDFLNHKNQKSILVPLSYNGVIINDEASKFESQLDFLLYILERIPKDIKVIATRHSLQLNGSIPKETEKFLLDKYSNLTFVYDLEKYAFLSQWLTPLVDGIISLNSTVAYHGALYNKKIIALGDCEINSVADDTDLDSIEKLLNNEKGEEDKSMNVLYRLLTRHGFSLKKFKDGKWLTKRLEDMYKLHIDGTLYTKYDALPKIEENDDEIFNILKTNTPGLNEEFKPRIK